MSTQLLTPEFALDAIELASPQIETLITNPFWSWGPALVAIVVDAPWFDYPVLAWVGDRNQTWQADWGEQKEFDTIAHWKARRARETGKPTSQLYQNNPLLLNSEDHFYPGGVPDQSGTIGIGTSGIRGWGDEAISYIVLAILQAKAHFAVKNLQELGFSHL